MLQVFSCFDGTPSSPYFVFHPSRGCASAGPACGSGVGEGGSSPPCGAATLLKQGALQVLSKETLERKQAALGPFHSFLKRKVGQLVSSHP